MSIARNLFDEVIPPAIWITLHEPEPALTDNRKLSVRVKPFGRKSFTLTTWISNYSPEDSVFRALAAWIHACQVAQGLLTRETAQNALTDAIATHVEPF